jgi:hypothetical protein
MQTPESEAALWKAIADPDALVRHHAADSLLELHGLATGDADPHPLTIKLMSDDVRERETAVAELQELLKQSE